MGLGLFLLSGLNEHSTLIDLLPGLILGGLGGAFTVPLANVAISSVPIDKAGVASGVFNTFRETGGSLGIAIIGAVFLAAQHHATATGATPAHAFASGYSHGLSVAALLAVLGAAIAALTINRQHPDTGTNTSNPGPTTPTSPGAQSPPDRQPPRLRAHPSPEPAAPGARPHNRPARRIPDARLGSELDAMSSHNGTRCRLGCRCHAPRQTRRARAAG